MGYMMTLIIGEMKDRTRFLRSPHFTAYVSLALASLLEVLQKDPSVL
jgi:hypothetical protein